MLMKYSDRLKELWNEEEKPKEDITDIETKRVEMLLDFYCEAVKDSKYCGAMKYSILISAQKLFDNAVKRKKNDNTKP